LLVAVPEQARLVLEFEGNVDESIGKVSKHLEGEQSTSLAYDPTVSHHSPTNHHQRTMGGGKLQLDGCHTGLIYLKWKNPVENSSVVDVNLCLCAQGNVDAMKLDLGVLHCAHVKEIVTFKLMHEVMYPN